MLLEQHCMMLEILSLRGEFQLSKFSIRRHLVFIRSTNHFVFFQEQNWFRIQYFMLKVGGTIITANQYISMNYFTFQCKGFPLMEYAHKLECFSIMNDKNCQLRQTMFRFKFQLIDLVWNFVNDFLAFIFLYVMYPSLIDDVLFRVSVGAQA